MSEYGEPKSPGRYATEGTLHEDTMRKMDRARAKLKTNEAKVENYKITKEMKDFSKNFKKVQQLSAILQQGLQIQLGEADQTRKMLHETNAIREQLLLQAPKSPTNEVEGQELDVRNLYMNY